jgi:hypothetical protein
LVKRDIDWIYMLTCHSSGRVEAKEAVKTRKPTMTSKHFINQYFQSFAEDPIMQSLAADNEGEEKKDIASLR